LHFCEIQSGSWEILCFSEIIEYSCSKQSYTCAPFLWHWIIIHCHKCRLEILLCCGILLQRNLLFTFFRFDHKKVVHFTCRVKYISVISVFCTRYLDFSFSVVHTQKMNIWTIHHILAPLDVSPAINLPK
jgi:hypothetical protein